MAEPPTAARCACFGCTNEAVSQEIIFCPACDDSWHWGHCPQCRGILPSSTRECPHCGAAPDAWLRDAPIAPALGMLVFVLYPVIFERRPQDRAAWIADQLRAAATDAAPSVFRRLRPGELETIVREIKAELARPTRQVSALLPMPNPSEADLRECLALVVARLEATGRG